MLYLQWTIPVTGREAFNIGLEFVAVLEGGALDNSPSFSVNTGHKLNGISLRALNDPGECCDHL
jgi:hypothetical protein